MHVNAHVKSSPEEQTANIKSSVHNSSESQFYTFVLYLFERFDESEFEVI